jgi:hypothetical protein
LDPRLDAVVMAHGRIVHRRHDTNSHSTSSHADANSSSQSDANADPNAESRPGM